MEKKIIEIKTDALKIEISTLGAELQSIKGCGGTEFLWNGDPSVWSGRAPIMFPICGGLKDDKYIYGGKEYTLLKHGFLKNSIFEVETQEENRAVLLLKSSEETKKAYPFDFEFRAGFTADGNELKITYSVKNLSNGAMYFSAGAHEAYACPEGIENYTVKFEKSENLDAYILNGNLLTDKINRVGENTDTLPLKEDYFDVDALVFKTIKSRKASLIKNGSTKRIDICFGGFNHLLLWNKYKAKYICIEPWNGIPDIEGSDYELENKASISKLEAGFETSLCHTITFTE